MRATFWVFIKEKLVTFSAPIVDNKEVFIEETLSPDKPSISIIDSLISLSISKHNTPQLTAVYPDNIQKTPGIPSQVLLVKLNGKQFPNSTEQEDLFIYDHIEITLLTSNGLITNWHIILASVTYSDAALPGAVFTK